MSHPVNTFEPENALAEDIEQEVCGSCRGTGEVPDFIFLQDAHEWVQDGTRLCICQISEPADQSGASDLPGYAPNR